MQTGRSRRSRGQALAEFAIVVPVFVAMIAGVIQFGLLFWAQNTLTQVVRDTGRWEATQQTAPCSAGASAVVTQANTIAGNSSLFGYRSTNPFVQYNPTSPSWPNGSVAVTWTNATPSVSGSSCPPPNNAQVWYVSITVRHTVPTFFPGMDYLPALGTCDPTNGCRITLSSTAQYRMEPKP